MEGRAPARPRTTDRELILKFRHPERSECEAFAQSKDPAAFTLDDQKRTRPRCQWPLRRLALDGSATLMPGAPKMQPRSFDSAQPTATGKVHPPLASLRMTERGNNTSSLVPKCNLGTREDAGYFNGYSIRPLLAQTRYEPLFFTSVSTTP